MKRIIKIGLITMFLLCNLITTVSAEDNDYEINGYIVTINGVSYDLSTEEGNYNLVYDNQDMSTEEYIEILNMVYNEMLIPVQRNLGGVGTNEMVPDDPGDGGGYTYFHSMSWFYRSDDGWNLSLNPKSIIRDNGPSFANAGWTNEVVYYQSGNSHWYNADSLYGQYICHYLFATYKTEWNLAPSIPNTTAFQWIVDRCN